MSIAEKLTTIAENEQKVYNAGEQKGYADGYRQGGDDGFESGFDYGKKEGYGEGFDAGLNQGYEDGKTAEYDRFWDTFQREGARKSYNATFRGQGWSMETYNPKYPILATDCETLFSNAQWLTDTLVPIDTTGTLAYGFSWCTSLETIRKLTVAKTTKYTNAFTGCSKLVNIFFDGTIGQNIDLSATNKLTAETRMLLAKCLYDYAADGDTSHTVKVHSSLTITDTEMATITQKGWSVVR